MFNTVVNIKLCLLNYHLEPHLSKLTPKQEYLPHLRSPETLWPKEPHFSKRAIFYWKISNMRYFRLPEISETSTMNFVWKFQGFMNDRVDWSCPWIPVGKVKRKV